MSEQAQRAAPIETPCGEVSQREAGYLLSLQKLIQSGARPTQAALASVWVALAAPTVAWCTINSRESVSLYGLLTIPAPLMALLTVVLVWFEVGPPLLGLFALSGCAAAYAYVRYGRSPYRGYATVRRPWEKAPVLRLRTFAPEREAAERGGFAPLRWWRAWQERRQLARLYRRSRSVDQEGKDNR